jgi:DNA-binding NarL/FixJ family response regulator
MSRYARVYALMIQPLLDLGLKMVFLEQPNYQYVGVFEDIQPLADELSLPPEDVTHVLIVDYRPTSEFNRTLCSGFRNVAANVKILLLLASDVEEESILGALRAGADGYVLHSATQDVLLKAVEELVAGRSYLQPHVTPLVLAELRKPVHPMKEWDKKIELTEQERMLIQLSADGLSNTQIADVLGLAEKTIRNLWSFLFKKLQLNDRTQAVMWAIRTGQAELR